jgi:hypothetical protein
MIIVLKLLMFLGCVNEMFSLPNIFAAYHLCMVEGGLFKGLKGKS